LSLLLARLEKRRAAAGRAPLSAASPPAGTPHPVGSGGARLEDPCPWRGSGTIGGSGNPRRWEAWAGAQAPAPLLPTLPPHGPCSGADSKVCSIRESMHGKQGPFNALRLRALIRPERLQMAPSVSRGRRHGDLSRRLPRNLRAPSARGGEGSTGPQGLAGAGGEGRA
jgi:hypothetical protein